MNGKSNEYTQIMMNPVNLRILQQIMMAGEMDAKQIAGKLPDVAVSSLYRHLAKLLESGIIKVVSETQMRGTIKKTYALNENFTQEDPSKEQLWSIVQKGLCIIAGEMQQYFNEGKSEAEELDLEKDCIDLSNVVVDVTPEEFAEMRNEILEIMKKHMAEPKKENSKTRRLTFISSPAFGGESTSKQEEK